MKQIEHLVEQLANYTWDDATGPEAHTALQMVLRLRNVVEHHATVLIARLTALGVAKKQGRTMRELLIVMGCAPAVASRLVRVAGNLALLPRLAGHTGDGTISGEHADAVVRGMTHIATRNGEPLSDSQRHSMVTDLLAHTFSGATPSEITNRARALGNQLADASDVGLPAAEDRAINDFTVTVNEPKTGGDGRTVVRGDLDAVIGEKLHTLIDAFSTPRPEPDGSADPRAPGRRRSDALERILDAAMTAADHGLLGGAPKQSILLTMPADADGRGVLSFTGPVSGATTSLLACDSTITDIIINGDNIPIAIGQDDRLFGPKLRKALIVRDQCCIKCGAPAGWTHAHHITFYSHGGKTVLDNGCLLCPSCHTDVHHNGWDVVMGDDRHPWLIPPASVDPRRRPQPAYNRRTMRLDNVAA
ncbi:HNH endonuclease [Gordonia bronchialis]|uniref:HNH endonuclease n=1 Tax=Gordonia bronchialis TaxID=2054 RepID=UPI001CBF2A8E|nr:HNH endonuclease signature motif containing protein [Gordonia bronchialis]UAK38910.1 HNH endonuclease [Gordonia bronchialis]